MANQTVNLPSKMLMARLASCRVVLWALETHGPRLVEILNGPLGRSLPDGMREFFEQHLTQLREVLRSARDLLIASDRKVRDQKTVAARQRRIRDEAFKELNTFVMGIKDTFRGACGDASTAEVGFALRMPVQAAELHEQAVHLMARLSQPDAELPAVRYRAVTLHPPSVVVEEMQPMVERLGVTLEDVSREQSKVDALKIAKDEALEAYNRAFLWVAQSAESLFKLANLPEIAKRVRPSSRRAGVTDEVDSQDPDIPPDPEEDTGEVVDEVPAAFRQDAARHPADTVGGRSVGLDRTFLSSRAAAWRRGSFLCRSSGCLAFLTRLRGRSGRIRLFDRKTPPRGSPMTAKTVLPVIGDSPLFFLTVNHDGGDSPLFFLTVNHDCGDSPLFFLTVHHDCGDSPLFFLTVHHDNG